MAQSSGCVCAHDGPAISDRCCRWRQSPSRAFCRLRSGPSLRAPNSNPRSTTLAPRQKKTPTQSRDESRLTGAGGSH
eukprot:2507824-Rhodomonas_salina.2